MTDLYREFEQSKFATKYNLNRDTTLSDAFKDFSRDVDKLEEAVVLFREFKDEKKIKDISSLTDALQFPKDKKIFKDRIVNLDKFSREPNEKNLNALAKRVGNLNEKGKVDFLFEEVNIEPEDAIKKMEEMEVEPAGGMAMVEEEKKEDDDEDARIKKLLERLDNVQAELGKQDERLADIFNEGIALENQRENQRLIERLDEFEKQVGEINTRIRERTMMSKEDIDLEEEEKDFLKDQRRIQKAKSEEKQEEARKEVKKMSKGVADEAIRKGMEKSMERAERSRMGKEDEERERKKLLEDAEKELDDVVDNLDRNRQKKAEIREEQAEKKDGRIRIEEERKLDKELDELTKKEAQIQKDIKKLSKSVADNAIRKGMERMEAIKEEQEDDEEDEDFLVLRRKQKAKMTKEDKQEEEQPEDDDEIEVMDLPDDELETPRGEPEEEKEEEKEGFHMMPDGTIMSGETHSSSSKPVDPMTISKPKMKELKQKQEQEQGIMDIPTGLTPLPEDRRSAEGKSVAQLKSDINYFFKNYGEILKAQIKQYKTLKKTKENLKNFHRRIVGILIPDMKEPMDGKKIGIVLDAEQYLNNKINEILLQKITEGLRPEDLLVDVTKPDDSQKRTGKQYGSYIVKGDRGGKLASERAPVFRAIPSSNEDKMEDPYKYEEKSNDIQLLRSQRWSKVNAAKKKVRIDPFIRYSKPSQIEIRL